MKNTHIITLLLIILIFTSCKQEDTYYTVKGRLTTDCSGTPMAGQELSLKQAPSIIGGGGVLGSATTDVNGNFTFTYNSSDCIDGENMRINCSGPIIENIPTQRNIDIGTIISYGKANFTISLVTIRPFTNADTLYFTNYDSHQTGNFKIKVGPFTNQVLDSIVSFTLGGPFNYGKNYSTLSIGYSINQSKTNNYKDVYFNVDNCGSWGNVNLVLE